jgi:hypothetical protein
MVLRPALTSLTAPLPNSFMIYLTQWLAVASGKHVKYSHYVQGRSQAFHVFKCTCGTNINIGEGLFHGAPDAGHGEVVPSELQDWVKQHRHVCKEFHPSNLVKTCSLCGWAESEHEKITFAHLSHEQKMQLFAEFKNTVEPEATKDLTLEQPTGRKFRS